MDALDYEYLHATVVDAIRYVPTQSIEGAAHEVLARLRKEGRLPIPPRPPDDPFVDHPAW